MGANVIRAGIRLARETDISDILAVQEEHWIVPQLSANIASEELGERGFLVHKLQQADLELFLTSPAASIIVCEHMLYKKVVAYAIGYTLAFHIRQHPDWPDTVEFIDQADRARIVTAEKVWYYRQQAVARKYQGRGLSDLFSRPVHWFALGQGCSSMLGEIVEAPYRNAASFRTVSKSSRIIGRIPDLYEEVRYTWAVVETPLR